MARRTVKLTDEEYRRNSEIRAREETAYQLLDAASKLMEHATMQRQEWWDAVLANHKVDARATIAELVPREPFMTLRPRGKADSQIRITKLHYERNPPRKR